MEKQKVMLTIGIVLVLLGIFSLVFLGRQQLAGKAFAVEQDYVAKWDFEESSGNRVVDDNGRYSGEMVGTGVKRINVREGTSDPRKALDFPGVAGNGIVVKDTTSPGAMPSGLQITTALTVSAWVKPARSPVNGMTIINATGWFLGNDGTNDHELSFKVGNVKATKANFFNDYFNEWIHIVGVMGEGGCLNLSLNGELFLNTPATDMCTVTGASDPVYAVAGVFPPLRIGFGNGGGSSNPWEGGIDDVRIYDRALNKSEINDSFYAGRTADCFNKYCPKPDGVGSLPALDNSKYDVDGNKNNFDNVEKTPSDAVANVAVLTTTDSLTGTINQPLFTNTFPGTFAHNNKNYQVVLAEQNQFEATAQLQVKSLASGQVLGSLGLSATTEKPLELLPTQTGLNLDTSTAEPEAYLQSFAYFNEGKVLRVLTGVTPFLNFDVATPWIASFLSGQSQQFLFDEELHTVEGSATGDGKFFLSIDGTEYLFSAVGDFFNHYLDSTKSKWINATLLKLSGDIAIFSFNREAAGLSNTYEEIITQTDSVTVGGKVLKVCANDPAIVAAVTLCEGTTEVLDLFNGVPKEGSSAVTTGGYDTALLNTLFFYEAPKERELKRVKVLHLVTLPTAGKTELAIYFANNLVQKKHLALKMGADDYYLLEMQDQTKSYLELTNLKLTHISDSAKSIYSPLGDQEKVKFNLPLQQQINLRLETIPGLKYIIEKTSSAIPEDVNLVNQLQASISSYGAVKVWDLSGASGIAQESALKTIFLASDDSTLSDSVMKISSGATISQELQYNVPAVLTGIIKDPDDAEAQLLAYYNKFTLAGTTSIKYADLYLLYGLKGDGTAKNHLFTDKEFILPLLKGNKLAFNVSGQFYLLSVAKPWTGVVTGGFNPEELRLTKLPEQAGALPISAQVSDDGKDLTFVLGNDINVRLDIDTYNKRITFKRESTTASLSAVAKQVNLMLDFKTTLTSSSPVNLLNSVGMISVSSQDTASFADRMIIEYSKAGTPTRQELLDNVPQIKIGEVTRTDDYSTGEILLLYNDFTSSLGVFTKSADVYLLYDLDESEKTRPFTDDEFILPLVEREQSIALKYKSNYYLLSYSGTLSQGFRFNRLRLKPLLGGSTISPTTTESGVQFSVAGGNLLINFDTLNRKITFGGALSIAPGQLPGSRVFNPAVEYQTELPSSSSNPGSDNVLSIGTTEMYNCDALAALGFTEQVCVRIRDTPEKFLQKGKPYYFVTSVGGVGGVIVTYREKSGDFKRVTVQHLAGTLQTSDVYRGFLLDWQQFSTNLKNGRYPVVALKNSSGEVTDYLEVRGTDVLDSVTLKSLLTGKEYSQKKVVTLSETLKEVYLAVDEKEFKFTQAFTDTVTKTFTLSIEWQAPLLVSAGGVDQVLPANGLSFTPSLGAPTYTVSGTVATTTDETATNVATVFIDDVNGRIFQSTVPKGSTVNVLLSNGEVVTVRVVSAVNGEVTVRLQK
ncbi:LamG domain-containing protein [Candidatus Woesearchaeota archaeon]|nr:LamG domain-containing protein [Candidatus Woesearchaeota archaeon]